MILTVEFVTNAFLALAFFDITIKFAKWIKIKNNSSKSFLNLQMKYFISNFAIQIPLIIQSPFVYRRYVDDNLSDVNIAHIKIVYNISSAIFSIFIGNILCRFEHRKIICFCNIISVIASTLRAIGKKTNFLIAAVFVGFAASNVRVSFEDWFISEESKITDCPNSHFIFSENLSLLNIIISVIFLSFSDQLHKKSGTRGIFYVTAILQFIGSLIVFFTLTKNQPNESKSASKENQQKITEESNSNSNNDKSEINKRLNLNENEHQTIENSNENESKIIENKNGKKSKEKIDALINSKKINSRKNISFKEAFNAVLISKDKLLIPMIFLDQLYGILVSLFWPSVPSYFTDKKIPMAKIIGMGQLSILLGTMIIPLICKKIESFIVLPLLFLLSSSYDFIIKFVFEDKFSLYWLIFFLCLNDGCIQSIMLGLRMKILPANARSHILGINKLFQSVFSSILISFSEKFSKNKQPLFSASVLFACFVLSTIILIISYQKGKKNN